GGAVVERSEFYPFGLLRYHQQNGFASAYKFTSKERDGETGLDYFEARYYHPVIGSFISVDPYEGSPGDQQDANRYAYVRNNPIRSIDPGGMSWVDAIATGLGVMDQVVETDSEKDGEEGEEGQSTLVQGLTRIGFHALSMAIAGDFSNSDKLFELALIAGSFALEVAQEETGWKELETIGGAGLGAAQMIKGIAEGNVGTAISSGLSAAESTASLFGGEGYVQGAYLTVGNVLDAMNSVYGGTTDLIGIDKKWFEPEKDKGKQAKSYWREKTGKDEAYQKLAPHAYDAYEFFGL
ncbi:MAG: RHS repeat-associated core domain-containing protein, partial [Desulfofustis sp.]|nr:RHS repeat-associated core domain-containing protein [Desulfofustis sp.]